MTALARQVVLEVEQHMQLLKRQSRVRVEQWLRKLAEKASLPALTGYVHPGHNSNKPPPCGKIAHCACAYQQAPLLRPCVLERQPLNEHLC